MVFDVNKFAKIVEGEHLSHLSDAALTVAANEIAQHADGGAGHPSALNPEAIEKLRRSIADEQGVRPAAKAPPAPFLRA